MDQKRQVLVLVLCSFSDRLTRWHREKCEDEICLRRSQGRRCQIKKKLWGRLLEPEILSVTVQIQLDGVHHECTAHKSLSYTHVPPGYDPSTPHM